MKTNLPSPDFERIPFDLTKYIYLFVPSIVALISAPILYFITK